MFAERLQHGEENTAVRSVDGTALGCGIVQEVEHTITARDGVVLRGQVIQAHQVKQRDTFHFAFGEISVWGAVGVAVVEDVEHEVVGADLISSYVVDVLHHQVPNRHLGVYGSAFQKLGDQNFRRIDVLVRELTDLVYLVRTDDGVLVGDGQGLVGIEVDIQGDEAQF